MCVQTAKRLDAVVTRIDRYKHSFSLLKPYIELHDGKTTVPKYLRNIAKSDVMRSKDGDLIRRKAKHIVRCWQEQILEGKKAVEREGHVADI